MKAIILSAGQGSRLLPLTEDTPKCLLPVGEQSLIGHQLAALRAGGVREAVVVTGFCAGSVERHLSEMRLDAMAIRCVFNPFFNVADNLASCWMVRHEMDADFVLLNGDTLFEPEVCARLLAAPAAPITMAVDHKGEYDSDDMKVRLDGMHVLEVGKTLSEARVDGEAIGMIRFSGQGPRLFAATVDQMMRAPNSLSRWYLKAVDLLAERRLVQICSIAGLRWGEVDFPHDLERAGVLFAGGDAAMLRAG